jgi:hypothetical protein
MSARRLAVLIAVVLLSLTRAASSAPASTVAGMQFFDGAWNCKRTANPDATLVGTEFAFQASSGAHVITESFSDGQIRISYNPSTQQYMFAYSGTDGTHEMFTSPGWEGDHVRLTEIAGSGARNPGAVTFTRHGSAVFTSSYVAGGAHYDNICARR